MPNAQPVTQIGFGRAEVKEVASNRRILGPDGKVRVTRYTATKDPAVRAEPEGTIDPEVSLISFWNGEAPVVVLRGLTEVQRRQFVLADNRIALVRAGIARCLAWS